MLWYNLIFCVCVGVDPILIYGGGLDVFKVWHHIHKFFNWWCSGVPGATHFFILVFQMWHMYIKKFFGKFWQVMESYFLIGKYAQKIIMVDVKQKFIF